MVGGGSKSGNWEIGGQLCERAFAISRGYQATCAEIQTATWRHKSCRVSTRPGEMQSDEVLET